MSADERLTGDVDDVMGNGGDSNKTTADRHWYDLGAVQPGDAVDQGIFAGQLTACVGILGWCGLTVAHHKDVDAEYCERFAYSVVCVLELSLHYRAVDFREDYAGYACEEHSRKHISSRLSSL